MEKTNGNQPAVTGPTATAALLFRLHWLDALRILGKEYAPLEWIIPDVLPEGLTMLFSRPKVGKSIVALALALRMALGVHGGVDGSVGFISLDDRSERRLQSRMRDLLQGMEMQEGKLFFCFDALRLDQGLIQQLVWALEDHPAMKLLVLDVYMSFKPRGSGAKGSVVQDDYDALAPLRQLALDHHLAILLLHHSRKPKAGADGDWIDEINGSTGLIAACDTIWKLERDRNGYKMALRQTGRDMIDGTLRLNLHDLGEDWARVIAEGEGEEPSDTEQRILDLFDAGDTEVLGPKEITAALAIAHNTTKCALRRLLAKRLIQQTTYGRYAKELQSFKTVQSVEICNSATLPEDQHARLLRLREQLRVELNKPEVLGASQKQRHEQLLRLWTRNEQLLQSFA